MKKRYTTFGGMKDVWGLGRSKGYELLEAGLIKAKKSGSRTLIDVDSVEAYMESLPDAQIGSGRHFPNTLAKGAGSTRQDIVENSEHAPRRQPSRRATSGTEKVRTSDASNSKDCGGGS